MTDHRITLARGTLAMIDRGGWTDPCEVMVGMLSGALRQLLQLVDESSAAVEALEQVHCAELAAAGGGPGTYTLRGEQLATVLQALEDGLEWRAGLPGWCLDCSRNGSLCPGHQADHALSGAYRVLAEQISEVTP